MTGEDERLPRPGADLARVVPIHPAAAADTAADNIVVLARELSRAVFGAAAIAADIVLETLTTVVAQSDQPSHPNQSGQPQPRAPASAPSGSSRSSEASEVVDAVFGVAWSAVRLGDAAAQRVAGLAGPVVRVTMSPPLLPKSLHPSELLATSTRRWQDERDDAIDTFGRWSGELGPAVGERASRLVDLDATVIAAVRAIPLQDVAETAVSRLDLDVLAARIVAEVDVRALAEQVVASVDLTTLVRGAIEGMDLAAVVGDALDQVDLTGVVVERVDLERVVVRAMESVDLTQLILDRVDLVRITDYVVDEVDLPEIIRDSTGSMATETLDDVRIQSIAADRAVAKVMGRLLRRKPEPT
jgi:hypothetical protein